MTTLREEIETVLHAVWGDVEHNGGSNVKEHTQEIIDIIDKTIDIQLNSLANDYNEATVRGYNTFVTEVHHRMLELHRLKDIIKK